MYSCTRPSRIVIGAIRVGVKQTVARDNNGVSVEAESQPQPFTVD
jgi:hypothetical protein